MAEAVTVPLRYESVLCHRSVELTPTGLAYVQADPASAMTGDAAPFASTYDFTPKCWYVTIGPVAGDPPLA